MDYNTLKIASGLYPDWSGPSVPLPKWVERYGLSKSPVIVNRVYASTPHWQQAEADKIPNIAPILVNYNKSPRDVRRLIGGEYWGRIHHDCLNANVNRLILMMRGGWSIDDAMVFPANKKIRANRYLKCSKSAVLLASRLHARGGTFDGFYIMANDTMRMGGVLDQTWGRKRLKAEHDALAMKMAMAKTDPTPWAKAWFGDVGPYSFSLLKSATELMIEGVVQRHCAGSYAIACRAGREFVMQITGKERATCSWLKGENYMQVKGFANTNVSDECRTAAIEARKMYLADLAKAKPHGAT